MDVENQAVETETTSESTTRGPRRVRSRILLVVAATVAIGVMAFGLSIVKPEDESKTRSLLEPTHTLAAVTEHREPILLEHKRSAIAALEKQLDVLSEWLTQRLRTLTANQVQLLEDFSSLAEQNRAIQSAIADLAEVQLQTDSQAEQILSSLEGVATQVQKLKSKPAPKLSAGRPSKRPAVPPFQIDAIDYWDNTANVAITRNGQVAFLQEGESQSGWKLVEVTPATGQVKFQGSKGQIHSAFVGR